MKKFFRLSQISGVAVGQTFTMELPLGSTYDQLQFLLSDGLLPSHIKNLEVVLSGKTIQTYRTMQEVVEMNEYYGRTPLSRTLTGTTIDDVVNLHFAQTHLEEVEDGDIFAIGTADGSVSSFTIRGEIDINAPASINAQSLKVNAIVSNPRPLGMMVKVKRFSKAFTAAGDQDFDTILRTGRIACIHIKSDVANALEKVKIAVSTTQGNATLVTDVTVDALTALQTQFGRRPDTEDAQGDLEQFYHRVDFCLNGKPQSSLVAGALNDLRVTLGMLAAAKIDFIVEYHQGFQGA